MREARVAYAARPLPSLTASGERLALELQRGVAATAVTPQEQLEGQVECACLGAFGSTKAPFEAKVAVAETVGAISVPEQGYCWISEPLVKHAAEVADAREAKDIRAIAMEGVLQQNYESEMEKMAKPRRKASARGREQAHASRFDAHGGVGTVLEAPVALTNAPGSFVSSYTKKVDVSGDLKAIADAVEANQKIRADSRVVCKPDRKSEDYRRLRPTALSEGSDLCPIEQRPMPAQIQ
jgi:hypothetical protein